MDTTWDLHLLLLAVTCMVCFYAPHTGKQDVRHDRYVTFP